ncbi:UDP-N-acetylglucosamine/UDP-glucose/GDP-mannose transporter [Dirofilaria immitis]|nr:UDP-N-acetylglucosamine/UDP-glucose/GDP-mannose transporter [Dirofilaria immitis]
MDDSSLLIRIGAAAAYAMCSVLVVFINKVLLTNFGFPSFLIVGLGQMAAIIIVLWFASLLDIVSIPSFDSSIPVKLYRVKASYAVKISIALMILGSVIAAVFDLTFDVWGYSMVLINDICTAANSVYMKQKLNAKKLGKYGLLYYNALFMIFPVFILAWINQEYEKMHQYVNAGNMTIWVVACLSFSFVCGFLLNCSIVLCTHYNSALTTSCVGPIKCEANRVTIKYNADRTADGESLTYMDAT